jgi:hypothetical protein
MATLHVSTIGGSPNTAVIDANYDSWLAARLDSSVAGKGLSPVNYLLAGSAADADEIYGVVGSKAASTESRAEDTIIRGGVTPVQFATAYVAADHQNRKVVASATAGVVQVHSTDPSIGRGRIVDGGTMSIKGTTRNVVYVDWDAN